ncbi:hypothetical protein V8C44DRAFT_274878 [Trichoderma aethiopicum]
MYFRHLSILVLFCFEYLLLWPTRSLRVTWGDTGKTIRRGGRTRIMSKCWNASSFLSALVYRLCLVSHVTAGCSRLLCMGLGVTIGLGRGTVDRADSGMPKRYRPYEITIAYQFQTSCHLMPCQGAKPRTEKGTGRGRMTKHLGLEWLFIVEGITTVSNRSQQMS